MFQPGLLFIPEKKWFEERGAEVYIYASDETENHNISNDCFPY